MVLNIQNSVIVLITVTKDVLPLKQNLMLSEVESKVGLRLKYVAIPEFVH